MERFLEGHFSLVTGSSRGIGRAIADALAGHGSHVAITSRKADESSAAAKEIAAMYNVRTVGYPCDVSEPGQVLQLFRQLHQWSSGRLDVLVCNAGFPFRQDIWNTPLHATPAEKLAQWYGDPFKTDTLGSVYCTFEALPMMMAGERGSIIYIASTPALEGYKGSPYTIAKAGILGLMRDIAHEYGRFNIRANALALGNIETEATIGNLDPDIRRALEQEAPLKRWGKPEEVGKAALFLASDLSGFMTGQTLVLDGGTVRR